jgi:uncharacterized membrane protein YphA (DoxX/SURF4 family)
VVQPPYVSLTDSLPSLGLLLLRVATGTALAVACWRALESGSLELITIQLIAIVLGIFLFLGFWTRLTSVIVSALELFSASSHNCNPWLSVLISALGAALSLLGPGCWSVDARISGWKRIEIPRRDK